jgi:hypothetical protein
MKTLKEIIYQNHNFLFKIGEFRPTITILAEAKEENFMNATLESGFYNMSDALYAFEQNKDYYIKKLLTYPGF